MTMAMMTKTINCKFEIGMDNAVIFYYHYFIDDFLLSILSSMLIIYLAVRQLRRQWQQQNWHGGTRVEQLPIPIPLTRLRREIIEEKMPTMPFPSSTILGCTDIIIFSTDIFSTNFFWLPPSDYRLLDVR